MDNIKKEYETRKSRILELRKLRQEAFKGAEIVLYYIEQIQDYDENMGDPVESFAEILLTREHADKVYNLYCANEPDAGNFIATTLYSFVIKDIIEITNHDDLYDFDLFSNATDIETLASNLNEGDELKSENIIITFQWDGYPNGRSKFIDATFPYDNYTGRLKYTSDLDMRGYERSFGRYQIVYDNIGEVNASNIPKVIEILQLTRDDCKDYLSDNELDFYFGSID